jgi:hypothetical protein
MQEEMDLVLPLHHMVLVVEAVLEGLALMEIQEVLLLAE